MTVYINPKSITQRVSLGGGTEVVAYRLKSQTHHIAIEYNGVVDYTGAFGVHMLPKSNRFSANDGQNVYWDGRGVTDAETDVYAGIAVYPDKQSHDSVCVFLGGGLQ